MKTLSATGAGKSEYTFGDVSAREHRSPLLRGW
jgi:hypothetical protein